MIISAPAFKKRIKAFEKKLPFPLRELAALLLCLLIPPVFQYPAVLAADFPLEQETAFYLSYFSRLTWGQSVFYPVYYAIYPGSNVLMKALTELYLAEKTAVYGVVLWLHLLNIVGVWLIVRAVLGASAAIASAYAFTCFNAYYHVLGNPVAGLALGWLYFMILMFLLAFVVLGSQQARLSSDTRRSLEALLIFIAFLLPLFLHVSLIFFGIVALGALAWRYKAKRWPAPVLLAKIVGAHLATLAIQVTRMDARFVSDNVVTRSTRYNPASMKLVSSVVENPFQYFFAAIHNAVSGAEFGLIYQNFLFASAPYSFAYLAGAAAFLIYLAGFAFLSREWWRAQLALGAMCLLLLFTVGMMRNMYNGEVNRIFDSYFVASMPRYYYLPSALLAVSCALCFLAIWERAKKLAWARPALALVAVAFLAGNVKFTRQKIRHLGSNMDSEIWNYVPEKILRTPKADPRNPSFLDGYGPNGGK